VQHCDAQYHYAEIVVDAVSVIARVSHTKYFFKGCVFKLSFNPSNGTLCPRWSDLIRMGGDNRLRQDANEMESGILDLVG
jgi:hypothetical protein